MKKFIKNLIIVSLLVIATIVVIPNVFAEFSTDNNSLTVSGLETDTNKDVSVNLYKIISVNTKNGQPENPVYKWDAKVAEWLNTKAPAKYKEYIDANGNVTEKFNKALENGETKVIDQFYDDLAAAIRDEDITEFSPVDTKTAKNVESVEFTGLKLGVYFILTNGGMKVYKPTSINIVPEYVDENPNDDVPGDWEVTADEVELKSSSPSIVKTVEDAQKEAAQVATGYIGKKVKYTLEVTIPHYPENTTNKTLFIEDQLSSGLDFVEDTTGDYVMVVTADGHPLTNGNNYSLKYEGRKITLHFDGTDEEPHKFYDTIKTYEKITIVYYATINKDAIEYITEGNKNTATLHYNTDSYGDNDPEPTTPDVKVFTYGLDLTKVDKNTPSKVLKGAEFVVSEKSDGSDPLSFVKVEDGVYRLAIDGETGVTPTTTLVATDGTLKVYGLDLGKYYVKETKAPAGYVIDPVPRPADLKDEEGGKPDGKLDDDSDGLLTFNFENTDSIIQLPVTGGIGTLIFSIIGVLFMGTSVVLVRNILKKKEVQL